MSRPLGQICKPRKPKRGPTLDKLLAQARIKQKQQEAERMAKWWDDHVLTIEKLRRMAANLNFKDIQTMAEDRSYGNQYSREEVEKIKAMRAGD